MNTDDARFRIRSADGQVDKRNSGNGIYINLSDAEKEEVERAIREHAPGTPNGKFARTALFYYIEKLGREGYAAILADILGA